MRRAAPGASGRCAGLYLSLRSSLRVLRAFVVSIVQSHQADDTLAADTGEEEVADVLDAVVGGGPAVGIGKKRHVLGVAGNALLEPFASDHPGFVGGDVERAEIAHARAIFGDDDTLRVAEDTTPFGIDFGDVERRAAADDAVVQLTASGIDKVQRAAEGEPMLLGIVAAKLLAIVEAPGLRIAEVGPSSDWDT